MVTVREVMQTELVTVRPDAPVRDAIMLLLRHRISGLPVVDAQRRLLGVVTEKDLMRLLYEEPGRITRVEQVMTRRVRTFQGDAPLAQVCDCLLANHFRRVPILDGERLVGLISRADLMPTIHEVLAAIPPE